MTSEFVLEAKVCFHDFKRSRHEPVCSFSIIYSLKALLHLRVSIALMLNLLSFTSSVKIIARLCIRL